MKTNKIRWEKSYDFMDNSPRYSFDGRDPQNSLEDIQVVIYTEKEEENKGLGDKRNFYYGCVTHIPSETRDIIGRFKYLKDAKRETEILFNKYVKLFD